MPKIKGIYVNLPKLLYQDTLDKMLLGYVLGFRHRNILHVLEIREACRKFLEDMNLTVEEYDLDVAVQTFYRLYNNYRDFREYNGGKETPIRKKEMKNIKNNRND